MEYPIVQFLVVFILPLVFVILLVANGRGAEARRKEVWGTQADQLSLSYDGDGRVEGSFGGMEVSAQLERRSHGRNSYRVTVFRVRIPNAPPELRIQPEALGTLLLKGVGLTTEHEMGDPDFDKQFLLQGPDEGSIHDWLTEECRAVLMKLTERFEEVQMGESILQAAFRSSFGEPEDLGSVLEEFMLIIEPLWQSEEAVLSPIERALSDSESNTQRESNF